MTNEIHTLRMTKEAMRKEVLFRKQREDQLETNIRKVTAELEKAHFEQEELNKNIDMDLEETARMREDNKRLKQSVDNLRHENRQD